MFDFIKGSTVLRRYRDNEDGNMAALFATTAVVLFGCMGAAMDFSTLSNADARSQAVADQTALAAAVYVSQNGSAPTNDNAGTNEAPSSNTGFLDKSVRVYSAAELGYEYKNFVDGGADNVKVEFSYDDINREVKTTVSGKTKPTFIQLLGKQNLSFSAESTAKYADYKIYDPASVLMVLDNSGSMAFDDKAVVQKAGGRWRDYQGRRYDSPDDAQPRIEALRSHARAFMVKLDSLVGNQSKNNDKILRTGLLAYNEDTITNRTVSMNWQTKNTTTSINNMVANGGTNSAPPVDLARIWMEREDNIHKGVHGDDPLKFLIFMTDGLNTNESVTWVEEEGTGQWRGRVTRCSTRRCRTNYEEVESEYRPSYGSDWTEGYFDSTANVQTLADCESMKNDGVKIYAIGFALAQGYYDTNGYYGDTRLSYTNSDTRSQAYSFLAGCASEPSTFLTAENAQQLQHAFDTIGNDIQTEIIRLSN